MKISKTKIEGVFVIDLEPRGDERGYFARVFAKEELAAKGVKFNIAPFFNR
jgi:dTDP-4-dehydrorhamnose 3,5-epimerase